MAEEVPTFDEWFERKYGTTFEAAHMQPMTRYEESIRALLGYGRNYLSDVARTIQAPALRDS